MPPWGFSRKRAPSWIDMRPATSLIGMSRGSWRLGSSTVSYAMQTAPERIMASVSSRSEAKWKYVKTTWSRRMRGYSGLMGSFTFMIISAMA